MLLRVLPQLVVVLALDGVATNARDLLHALIVRRKKLTTTHTPLVRNPRIFGPDHIILAVVDADDIDSVRNFALQSRLMQWNTVKIHATYSIEEAVGMIDDVEAIF